ncbi:MAG: nicotinate (nicotinamide) nucleotide adenylyltransferase, partial [Candidatus Nanoarchaeia archaeon]
MTNTRLKKIALFGGSFNPIHNQHINLIKKLSISNVVDEIWIIPCKKHAFAKHFAPVKDRLNMIKLGIKDIPKTKICKIELNSKITNYTINTIKKLKTRYPKNEFFWVIGSDILYEITKWNNYQELLNETQFIVFIRKGYAIKKVNG